MELEKVNSISLRVYESEKKRLVVMDFGNHKVQMFSQDGKFLNMFGIGTVYTEPEERAKDVNKDLKKSFK